VLSSALTMSFMPLTQAFLIVVFAGHGNFQYNGTEILCSYYAQYILIKAFTIVAFAGHGNLKILSH